MNKSIKCVIFDWAGTTIDFGCFAPLNVFVEIFERQGIDITVEEARAPMGMLKRDHIKAILSMPEIGRKWEEKKGRVFTDSDIADLYADFELALMKILHMYTGVIDGVLTVCDELRSRNIKIGSTTGYTSKMMEVVKAGAAENGYSPDSVVTADDVGLGRPYPYMIFRNMQNLNVYPPKSVIKIGDTVSDIKEGINAGVWSAGVVVGSSEMGLTQNEYAKLTPEHKNDIHAKVRKTFTDAGADFVIDKISELPELIDRINNTKRGQIS